MAIIKTSSSKNIGYKTQNISVMPNDLILNTGLEDQRRWKQGIDKETRAKLWSVGLLIVDIAVALNYKLIFLLK